MVRIGIVGLGDRIGIAKNHIKGYLLQPDAVITALYDIIPGQAEKYKDTFKLDKAEICSSYEELLAKCDAVSICTPNAVHIPLAVEALKAQKHVLCEKPFSVDAGSCHDALVMEKLSRKVCMIGLCYRGIPAYRYIKELVGSGYVGRVYYVRETLCGGRIADPAVKCEWRMQKDLSGPGAVADFGSHMLDMTDWILRPSCGPIVQVQCMEGRFFQERQSETSDRMQAVTNDDVAVFNARMENGTLVSFTASRIGGDHIFEVYGSDGYVGFHGNPFEVTMNKRGGKKETVQVPDELYKVNPNVPAVPFDINFYFETREFLDSITKGADITTGFSRGLYIQKLIDALDYSAELGASVDIEFEE